MKLMFASAAVLLAAPACPAQQPPSEEPVLTLRSTTRLVQVDVIVRGRDSKPLSGLKQEDFEIREDGKPQRVRYFIDHQRAAPQAQELPSGMLSNRPGAERPRRGVTVILLDSLNTKWQSRAQAIDALRAYLSAANPDDRIALYSLGHDLKVFHDFHGDARSLQKKLAQPRDTPLAGRGEAATMDDLIPEVNQLAAWSRGVETEVLTRVRAERTLRTLESVANHLGSTPGRKSLVWISDGFPMQVGMDMTGGSWAGSRGGKIRSGEMLSFQTEFEKAVRALTSSNVAVFPIDPTGLQALPEFDAAGGRQPAASRPWMGTDSMFTQMAARTGGRAYVSVNGIRESLREITDDAQVTYTLAYYPSNSRFDGKYRKLEIRMKPAGLTANHRQGYYALDEGGARRGDPQQDLRAAALDPLDSALIGIDAVLRPGEGGAGAELAARIDAAELLWEADGGFTVDTTVGVFQYDADGRQLASLSDNVSFKCNPKQAALLSQHGLSYSRKLVLDPGAVRVRLAVRSARTGAIGSITLPTGR
jgi:VWFA-related protein